MNDDKNLAYISGAKAKALLTELANLEKDSMNMFLKLYGKMIPNQFGPGDLDESTIQAHSDSIVQEEGFTFHIRGYLSHTVLQLRNILRRVWVEPNLRTRRYGVFLLWHWAMNSDLLDGAYIGVPLMPSTLPSPGPFEQCLQYLLDSADLALYCANVDCPHPYFFASRRSQKYCSDLCARPAQKESKRQWWAEHGEEWRTTRKEGSKKGSKQHGKRKESR